MKTTLPMLILAVAVTATANAAAPRVVHHALPALRDVASGVAAVERYGCRADGRAGELRCGKDSPLAGLGCERVWSSPTLGGVTPAEPLFGCDVSDPKRSFARSDYVLASGGLLPLYVRYVAIGAAGPVLLRSADSFRQRYAPVDSAAEALTFATALTGMAVFDPTDPPQKLRYFLDVLEGTEVIATDAGYLVKNLMDVQVFGCGPHTTSLVDVAVSRDGSIRLVGQRKAFEDPKDDGLCVD